MSFEDMWKAAEAPAKKSYDALPKGSYTAICDEVVIDLITEKISYTLKIAEGDHKNRLVWRSLPLNKDWAIAALKEDIATLGLDDSKVKGPQDLGPILQTIHGKKLKIGVTQREYNGKTYNNCYINGYFNEAEGISSDAPSADLDESLPF